MNAKLYVFVFLFLNLKPVRSVELTGKTPQLGLFKNRIIYVPKFSEITLDNADDDDAKTLQLSSERHLANGKVNRTATTPATLPIKPHHSTITTCLSGCSPARQAGRQLQL